EEQGAVGAEGDVTGDGAELERELGDGAGGGDAADLVPTRFREVQRAIRPGDDVLRVVGRDGQGELGGDGAAGGDAADLGGAGLGIDAADAVAEPLGEVEIAVRTGNDVEGPAAGNEVDLGSDGSSRSDASDFVGVELREPEIAIRGAGDTRRAARRSWDAELH